MVLLLKIIALKILGIDTYFEPSPLEVGGFSLSRVSLSLRDGSLYEKHMLFLLSFFDVDRIEECIYCEVCFLKTSRDLVNSIWIVAQIVQESMGLGNYTFPRVMR